MKHRGTRLGETESHNRFPSHLCHQKIENIHRRLEKEIYLRNCYKSNVLSFFVSLSPTEIARGRKEVKGGEKWREARYREFY